jgi:hypothetical protein
MKMNLPLSAILIASAIPCAWAGKADDQPSSMIRMVVRVMGPGIKPGTFPALPKTIYRAGAHHARIEDPPDARQRLQKLTIISEPDAYSINLITRRGTHAVDQGGPDDLHLPIVLPFDPKHRLPKLDRLEFGDEYSFFEEAGAEKQGGPVINGKPTDSLRLGPAEGGATLVLRSGTEIPITLTWHGDGGDYKYEYIEYKELPYDTNLFKKPEGITYREIPPDNTGRD